MIAVYVAGALNADAVGYLQNVSKMIKHACKLRSFGLAVFCPAEDLLSGIVDGAIKYHEYAKNSMEWLRRSDMVSLVPGNWKDSKGTKYEKEEAARLGIPVFDDVNKMMLYVRSIEKAPLPKEEPDLYDKHLLDSIWRQYQWMVKEVSKHATPEMEYILKGNCETDKLVRQINDALGDG